MIIKRTALLGINHSTLGKTMSVFWHMAKVATRGNSIPGRYRTALILENVSGFLRIKEDGIYRGKERFAVHSAVCKDLLQHGILQLRVKPKTSFEEWLSFLRTKEPTKKIKINMAIAPEVVRIWNPKTKGSSTQFNPLGTFTILERLPIFSSSMIGLRLEEVELPNRVVTSWLTIDSPGSVEIVPVTEDGKILLIEQPRHTAPPGWEAPAGILEKGVAPEEQAALELREETGFKAAEFIPLAQYYIFVGWSNQTMQLFLARGLTQVGREMEEHESIGAVKSFTPEEIWKMIEKGEIRDSHTIVAVTLAMRFLSKK